MFSLQYKSHPSPSLAGLSYGNVCSCTLGLTLTGSTNSVQVVRSSIPILASDVHNKVSGTFISTEQYFTVDYFWTFPGLGCSNMNAIFWISRNSPAHIRYKSH